MTLNKHSDEIVVHAPPGELLTMQMNHSQIRRDDRSAYYNRLAAGDDGTLRLELKDIYDIWSNTDVSLYRSLPEGDRIYAAPDAPGLIVNATYNSARLAAAPRSAITLTVKRGSTVKGSAQALTDGAGVSNVQGVCQGNNPVDIAAGDRVVLGDNAAAIDIAGIAATLDTAANRLTGVGPAGAWLEAKFYIHKAWIGGGYKWRR